MKEQIKRKGNIYMCKGRAWNMGQTGASTCPIAYTFGGSKWLTSHCLIFQHDEMEVNRILYLCTCLSFTLHGSVCFVETKLLISCKTECAVTPLSVHVERLLSPSFCSTETQLLA